LPAADPAAIASRRDLNRINLVMRQPAIMAAALCRFPRPRLLVDLGVYPFIVPFVPVTGTPLAMHRPPSAEFLRSVLGPVGRWLSEAGMTSDTVKAGCAKCAACSTLSIFETPTASAA